MKTPLATYSAKLDQLNVKWAEYNKGIEKTQRSSKPVSMMTTLIRLQHHIALSQEAIYLNKQITECIQQDTDEALKSTEEVLNTTDSNPDEK